MFSPYTIGDLIAAIRLIGPFCQVGTAVIAASIGAVTYRFTRRQNALALANQNNALANLVHTTVIHSEEARQTFGKLHDCIVGSPDDAVLLMYLNYVHNTYRMHQIGAVSAQVWGDTLGACANMVGRLRREQVQRLLARGYEAGFQAEVLARYDLAAPRRQADADVLTTIRPRRQGAAARQVSAA